MISAPTGLVTLLFTDIEGSTRLARELGGERTAALARHNEILDRAIAAHGGYVEGTAGDSYLALFADPRAAVAAAVRAQRELAPLGEHRLRDFPEPERLFQVVVDGRGPEAFPALRSAPARPTNLPVELRPLLGREEELAALRDAVLTDDRRLHTLLGLGGTGKSRLALAVARDLLDEHEGGVWFVPLAGVREPEALMPSVAALGVTDDPGRLLAAAVAARVGERPTLVVLDNLEQLLAAAPAIGALLGEAPGLRVLATSQLPLRLERERLHRLEALRREAAVELFAQRAAAVLPGFDLEAERPHVEQIAERVGGMPLAIELAAARVAVLTPAWLLERLDRTLGTPARGATELEERHRSLRATLQWTHGLLGPEEQILLARLAAFAGPAPLDAVEAVAEAPGASASASSSWAARARHPVDGPVAAWAATVRSAALVVLGRADEARELAGQVEPALRGARRGAAGPLRARPQRRLGRAAGARAGGGGRRRVGRGGPCERRRHEPRSRPRLSGVDAGADGARRGGARGDRGAGAARPAVARLDAPPAAERHAGGLGDGRRGLAGGGARLRAQRAHGAGHPRRRPDLLGPHGADPRPCPDGQPRAGTGVRRPHGRADDRHGDDAGTHAGLGPKGRGGTRRGARGARARGGRRGDRPRGRAHPL